jgi:3-deoxy-D-manno-octulosonate 8-phosphate phosphatase (KDO 8-P phosphatase)
MSILLSPDAAQRAARVSVMIFDVDGVLTDGKLYYGPEGEVLKAFHTLDGHGLKMLQQGGIRTAIITGRESPMVERRARELGFDWLRMNVHDKAAAFTQLQQDLQVAPAACGYMGDDVVDLPVMSRVAFAATVANAPASVLPHAHWQAQQAAGHGAVRELCDYLLETQGKLQALVQAYLA